MIREVVYCLITVDVQLSPVGGKVISPDNSDISDNQLEESVTDL
jgi:hypothetical protein